MSGDYLFSYDSTGCEREAGNPAAPEFFACMEKLGYFQVDPVSGVPVASARNRQAQENPATTAARQTSAAL